MEQILAMLALSLLQKTAAQIAAKPHVNSYELAAVQGVSAYVANELSGHAQKSGDAVLQGVLSALAPALAAVVPTTAKPA